MEVDTVGLHVYTEDMKNTTSFDRALITSRRYTTEEAATHAAKEHNHNRTFSETYQVKPAENGEFKLIPNHSHPWW